MSEPGMEATEGARRGLGQRKRKLKFDVKQVLNMRTASSTSKPTTPKAATSTASTAVTTASAVTTTTTTAATTTGTAASTSIVTTATTAKATTSIATTAATPLPAESKDRSAQKLARRSSSSRRSEESASVLVEGKRERKRKRFWDEEDDVALSKIASSAEERKEKKRKLSLSKTTSSNSSIKKSKGQKQSETETKEALVEKEIERPLPTHQPEKIDEDEKESKVESNKETFAPCKSDLDVADKKLEEPKAIESGDSRKKSSSHADVPKVVRKNAFPKYTELDLNACPTELAEQLRAGVNIPGPGSPLVLDSPFLPQGWERRVVERKVGVTKGKWEVLVFSPVGKSFRSKMDLNRYVTDHQLTHLFPEQAFDFSLDEPLKKLRQIWKQAFSCVPSSSSKSISYSQPKKIDSKKKKSLLKSSVTVPPASKSSGTNEVVGIESETGQGVRCAHCKKLFRTELLLHEHIKHYHGQLFKGITNKLDVTGTKQDTSEILDALSIVGEATASTESKKTASGDDIVGNELGTTPKTTTSPPTYRVSRRRQVEMTRRRLSLSRQPSGEPTPNFMEAYISFLGTTQETPEESNSYPPSELDGTSVVSEHLTSEEVVNCWCKRTEEDGLMIQCDICLCWQHSICLGMDEGEQRIPEKYICHLCKHARGTRSKSRFALDTDWLREGKLPRLDARFGDHHEPQIAEEMLFERLSNLMADLVNLQPVLHAIKVKLQVAKDNSGKVFIWSSPWHAAEPTVAPQNNQGDAVNFICNNDLGVDTIEATMIPSASEVQSLIHAGLAGGTLGGDIGNASQEYDEESQPQMIVPEQKRLDKDVSRRYLLDHVIAMQDKVNRALDVIELRLEKLENPTTYQSEEEKVIEDRRLDQQTKTLSTTLMQDLDIARKLIVEISPSEEQRPT